MVNKNPNVSTRFSSTNQPGIGVPKGRGRHSINKKRVEAKMAEELEKMLGQAHTNIQKSLRKGDVRVSMWLVDTVQKKAAGRVKPELLSPLIQAVETFEDIEQVSQQALMLAIKGDMTFDQLKAVQEALARHSVLKGVVEIGDLRRELREIKAETVEVNDLGSGHMPTWGKLIDHEEKAG